jgi:hypothetical protein
VSYAKRTHKRIIALEDLAPYVKSKADDKRHIQLLWFKALVGIIAIVILAIIGIVVLGFFRKKRPS